MKRLPRLMLVTCLLLTMLLGCSTPTTTAPAAQTGAVAPPPKSAAPAAPAAPAPNFNAEGYPIVQEKVTFSMMGSKAPIQGPWDTLLFFKTMQELTGVAFTFDTPVNDAFEEKKNLAINTGEYPQVLFGANLNAQQIVRYGSTEKILLPLEDYIEAYCPNIQAMLIAHPDIRKSITAPDGHIYALPGVSKGVKWAPTFWFNYEWLKALDVSEADLPKTTDDLYDLFVRMKTEDPNGNNQADELPLSFVKPTSTSSQLREMLLPAFGVLYTGNGIYVQDDVVKSCYLEPNYADYLRYCNKLWTQGLIDPDSFMQDSSARDAKCKSNLVGLSQQALPQNLYDCPQPEDAVNYPILSPMTSPVNDTPVTMTGTGITGGTFALTNKCEQPEVMMRWVDYLYSEEGSLFIHYGPEDDLWKYVQDGLMEFNIPKDGRTHEEYRGGVLTPDCGTAMPKWVRDNTERNWNDVFQQYRLGDCIDTKLAPYAVTPFPSVYTLPEEQAELDALLVDLNKYTESMESKFITGEVDIEGGLDAFYTTLQKMQADRLVEVYQIAYDRWNQ